VHFVNGMAVSDTISFFVSFLSDFLGNHMARGIGSVFGIHTSRSRCNNIFDLMKQNLQC
jgi:hypothetical protein